MAPEALRRAATVSQDVAQRTSDRLHRKPVIVTVPSRDLAFRVHVEAAMCGVGGTAPEALEAVLRQAYPRVVVRASEAFGTIVPEDLRWYVYRDRHHPEATTTDRWWDDLSLPRTVMDANGRYTHANEGTASLFGVSRDQIIGALAGTFTKHEGSDILRDRLFKALQQSGELCSTAVVVKPDGSEEHVDFHTSRSANGECTTVLRPRLGSSGGTRGRGD